MKGAPDKRRKNIDYIDDDEREKKSK